MLTVDDYGRIRRAHRDGMSIRAIARTLHHSRRKVREALACPEPRPYTRSKDPPAPKLGPLKPIIDEILAAQPDVLLLQEYTPRWQEQFQAALGQEYPFVHAAARQDCFGQAIYSRHPIVGSVDAALPLGKLGTPQIRAVVRISGSEIAFYNVHLVPPINRTYTTERRREFADLLELLEREGLPVVLAGDFNFTNSSPFADELGRRDLTDAHTIAWRS